MFSITLSALPKIPLSTAEPVFRFHDLRLGYATLAFAAGVPLKVVSESLGHSAIGVMDAIYVHLRDESQERKGRPP